MALDEFVLGNGHGVENCVLKRVERIGRILGEFFAVEEERERHRRLVAHRPEELEKRAVRNRGSHSGGGEGIPDERADLRDGGSLRRHVGDLERPYALPCGERGKRGCDYKCGEELFH